MLESQLDFLNNYYQFSSDFLTLERIKQLSGLTSYILWGKIVINSDSINTRVVAELIAKIRQGPDNLSSNILADTLKQMEKSTKEIIDVLRKITVYQREIYKRNLRERLFHKLNLKPEAVRSRRDDTIQAVRYKFAQEMSGTPFYTELVEEVIDEDFSQGSEQLRINLLERIAVKEKKQEEKAEISFIPILLEAIRTLGGSAGHIEQAMRKLSENSYILSQRKMSFREKFRRWLYNISRKGEKHAVYEIEFLDIATSATKTEKLDFTLFKDRTMKKVRVLQSVFNRMSSTYRQLETASEDRLYDFLQGLGADVQEILRVLPALDTYFKSEASREERVNIKGIKIEITAIKNSLVKSNQKKYEFVSRKEEEEQLKRLGIKV